MSGTDQGLTLGVSALASDVPELVLLMASIAKAPTLPSAVRIWVQGVDDDWLDEDALSESLHAEVAALAARGVMVSIDRDAGVGLARSRNRILRDCGTPLLLLGDADCRYEETDFDDLTRRAKTLDGWVALGRIRTKAGWYKLYPGERKLVRIWEVFSASSVAMVINVEQIRLRGLEFDERLGLGTALASGEEAVFLAGVMAKGGPVVFDPELVTCLHPSERSLVPGESRAAGFGAAAAVVAGPGSVLLIGKWCLGLAVPLAERLRLGSAAWRAAWQWRSHFLRPLMVAALRSGARRD